MAISDIDQHIPFINIVDDGVTSIDTFNTWRKKTNSTIKVINDGLVTRYIADLAITPPKLSEGGPYWNLNGDFHTNGNNTRLGYLRNGGINVYVGYDLITDGNSSLLFQSARAAGGRGSGVNGASITKLSGAVGAFQIANTAGQININTDGGSLINFNVSSQNIAKFSSAGLAVTDEILSRNVKLHDNVTPYYRLTSSSPGSQSWNLESSGNRLCIRSGTIAINTTITLPRTAFSRTTNIVTVTSPIHGYVAGTRVTISGTIPIELQGTYIIDSVPNANSFTYKTPSSGFLQPVGTGSATLAMVLNPTTPFQILNDNSVIVGGKLEASARSGDEFTVLGDSYLNGSLTVTGSDTIIAYSINATPASLSIGKNRTAIGSSAVKLYTSGTTNATETASITHNNTDLTIHNGGSGSTIFTGDSYKFQSKNGNDDFVDRLLIDKSTGLVTIINKLKLVGGFDTTTVIPSIDTAKRLENAFGDGIGSIMGPGGSTDYGATQTYFKLGTALSDDYLLVVGGNRTATDRTGIVIRSHATEWTPAKLQNGTLDTNNYNTDGLYIEKGSDIDGNAGIFNSGSGTFEISNRGRGNILFRSSPSGATTPNIITHLTIAGDTGEATFAQKVIAPRFSGPLTGNVTGNITGNVVGNLNGTVVGNVDSDTGYLATSKIKINTDNIRVDGNLHINQTRKDGSLAVLKQNTIIYNGAGSTIALFKGLDLSTEFLGNAVLKPDNKLVVERAGTTNARARIQIGNWYIGQSTNSDQNEQFYIARNDAPTVTTPSLIINSANGKITGTITNADISASCTGNAASVTNGVYTVGDQKGNNAIDGIKAFKKVILLSNDGIMFDSDSNENTGFTWSSENVINVRISGTTRGTFKSTGWNGKVVGDVTGNVKGNVEGNVKGNVEGFLTGNISGSSASCIGNSATVTDGMYLSKNQTVTGINRFTKKVVLSNDGIMFDSDSNENTGFTWSSENAIDVKTAGVIRGTFKSTGWNGKVVGDVTGNVKGNVEGFLTGNISGSSASCIGNSATVTNGVYRVGDQLNIDGVKGFVKAIRLSNDGIVFASDTNTGFTWSNNGIFNVVCDGTRAGQFTKTGWTGNAATATSATYATRAGNSSTTDKLDTVALVTKGNQINPGSWGELALTHQNADGGTDSFYDTTIYDGKRNIVTRFSGQHKTQYNCGNIVINNDWPTLYLQDTNNRSAMVHVNSNIFYILRGGVNSTTWDPEGAAWPLQINLTNNWATFGGNITANGAIRASGDIIAYSASDKNLKSNIKRIKDPLQKIAQLSGNTFKWNSKKQDVYEGEDVGVIAQEVEEVLPSAVITREDGTKAVRYEKIIPLLIESIKELHTLNSTLLARIEQLEK